MPITVRCSCGKRTSVGDALGGRFMRCPGCGEEVLVPAANAPAKGARGAQATKPAGVKQPIIAGGTLAFLGVFGFLLIAIVGFIAGPKHVWNQWNAMSGKANDDVVSVLEFGLQAYLSQHGKYDPSNTHARPHIDRDAVNFIPPVLAFTMPDKVAFSGKSSQGDFKGTYNPRNGEIDADVAIGGMTVAGLVDLKKSTDGFLMTGRMGKDGNVQAESEGKKLELFWPKHSDD